MKILFANNLCGHYGGVEQVIADTARELGRRGHHCHLAFARAGTDPEDFARLFASAIRCSDFGGEPAKAGAVPFETIVSRVQPDVVYFHKVGKLPEGLEAATDYRKVVMVHDNDLWCPTGLGYDRRTLRMCSHSAGWQCYLSLAFLEKRKRGILPFGFTNVHARISEMRRYHNFHAILANSTFIREKLLANGFPGEKTYLCHPIVDQSQVEPTPVPEEPVILFVGSLIRGKGLNLLLQALGELYSAYRLVVVGAGKSEPELRKQAKELGVAGAVEFAGWVPNDLVAAYYRRAKVVAVPSVWPEPFGLVGVEAMRHGRPVVAFRVGGIPDWLADGETGLLAPPGNVAAFAERLQSLLADTALAQKLGKNGATRAAGKFSFSRYIDKLEGLLAGHGEVRDA